jgi:hypothetical protein
MITPSFSITATERVLPKLALDFTTASLDPRVTFTRSGNTATVVNSSGVIVGVNANVPRFDFNPVTLTCQGLLIEESRTNLLVRSNEFANASWSKSGSTITSNAAVSPSGLTDAKKMVSTATLEAHLAYQDVALTSGTSYTYTVYAKKGEWQYLVMRFIAGGAWATNYICLFDLNAGTATNNPGLPVTAFSITDAGNGYYRCSITQAASSTATGSCGLYISNSPSTTSVLGDGTSGLFFYGAQIEAGAFATSYIPTVASQVTRNADVATMTGTNFSDWYNASEASSVVQVIQKTISGTCPACEFDDNTANESIALRSVAADPQLFVVDGGATQATLDAGTIATNTAYKLGGAWKASSFATAVNGASSVTQASGTLPTVTQARLGSDGVNYLNGWLQNLRCWSQRIINAEVQAFSK